MFFQFQSGSPVEMNVISESRELYNQARKHAEVASAARQKAVEVVAQKRAQEELDRKLAEKLVIEEARQMYG